MLIILLAEQGDIGLNLEQILAQIKEAADRQARVVHFCEAALSGYLGVDVPDGQLDWDALHAATKRVCQAAAEHEVWVLLGSAHRLTGDRKPHNSVYVIDDRGQVVERYDKRFCTGYDGPEPTLDHVWYTPGNHTAIFEIDGFRASTLICYDYRFPELYRDLKRNGVQLVFQSFHNARRDYRTFHNRNLWKDLVPATMICHAATNHFWISSANSSKKYSLWGSFVVRPDGRLVSKVPVQHPAVLISEIDADLELWDAAQPWRDRAMQGELNSGTVPSDPRSDDRTSY